MTRTADETSQFEAHRGALIGLAYRMLGSRAEAEDVVQGAYLRLAHGGPREHRATSASRTQPRASSPTMFRWRSCWCSSDSHPSSARAFCCTMSLGWIFPRLPARWAAATPAAASSRCVPAHIEAGRPRFSASHEEGDRLAAAFRRAAAAGDMAARTQLLATDVVLYGGGKRSAALNPIHGADKILRFLAGIGRKDPSILTTTVRAAVVNGCPAWCCGRRTASRHGRDRAPWRADYGDLSHTQPG